MAESPEREMPSGRRGGFWGGDPARWPPLVFAVILPFVGVLVLLPAEFTHYKRWLDLDADATLLRVAVFAAVAGKSAAALLGLVAGLAVVAPRVTGRTCRVLSLGATLGLLGTLAIDLELQRSTGINLSHYWPYLLDPDTFVWVGDGFSLGPVLTAATRRVVPALGAGALVAWAVERWVARAPSRRAPAVVSGAIATLGLALVAAPTLEGRAGAPAYLYQLSEQMPWSGRLGLASSFEAQDVRQRAARRLFDLARPDLEEPRRFDEALVGTTPTRRPDILLVVVESFRADALDAETMPRLWRAAESGRRFDAHYATSNASHYGLFALLYGRTPLRYYETLDAGEAPTLPSRLREWGYTPHHVTCSDIRWRRMDEFMGPPHFAVDRFEGRPLEECDRDVIRRAGELLAPGARPPRFVLAFLMSTHYGYHYPEADEVFRPSAPPPNALASAADRDLERLRNRYRNSAHHVDALVGELLDRIDRDATVVVVTGDHGESLFDDGTIAHASLLSDVQTRVPFALFGAGVGAGPPDARPSDHSDLLPTLSRLLGIAPAERDALPGQDLLAERDAEFAALVHAKARGGGEDRIALVSPTARFAVRLDLARGDLRLLGRLRADGRPEADRGSESGDARVVRWLDDYLEALRPD